MRQGYYKSSVTYDVGVFQELGDSWDRDISRAQWLMRQRYKKSSVTYEACILQEIGDF